MGGSGPRRSAWESHEGGSGAVAELAREPLELALTSARELAEAQGELVTATDGGDGGLRKCRDSGERGGGGSGERGDSGERDGRGSGKRGDSGEGDGGGLGERGDGGERDGRGLGEGSDSARGVGS